MTPNELQDIRQRTKAGKAEGIFKDRRDLLAYIDLLHEDLALTRQERDHAKHQALEHHKARARLEYDLLARAEKDTE